MVGKATVRDAARALGTVELTTRSTAAGTQQLRAGAGHDARSPFHYPVANEFKRGKFSAMFMLACLAALELEGSDLGEL
jgi:hypothetical protein